jgi:hypothetical protein
VTNDYRNEPSPLAVQFTLGSVGVLQYSNNPGST